MPEWGRLESPANRKRMSKMRTLTEKELESTGGGLLGITGVAAGLEVSSIGGALAFAWGAGYLVGTGIYMGYNYLRYGEF